MSVHFRCLSPALTGRVIGLARPSHGHLTSSRQANPGFPGHQKFQAWHLISSFSTSPINSSHPSPPPVRIGCASGFWGDTMVSTPQLLHKGKLDYLVLDYLSEITMSLLAAAKQKAPDKGGYCPDFVQAVMKPNLKIIQKKGVKVSGDRQLRWCESSCLCPRLGHCGRSCRSSTQDRSSGW
jgi:hypothetical protein